MMKKIKMLYRILHETGFMTFVTSFVGFIFLAAAILRITEPGITNYADGLWFAFVTSTTVGYGDFLAVTLIGRLTSVALTLYGLVFFAALSGVIINYYSNLLKKEKK